MKPIGVADPDPVTPRTWAGLSMVPSIERGSGVSDRVTTTEFDFIRTPPPLSSKALRQWGKGLAEADELDLEQLGHRQHVSDGHKRKKAITSGEHDDRVNLSLETG